MGTPRGRHGYGARRPIGPAPAAAAMLSPTDAPWGGRPVSRVSGMTVHEPGLFTNGVRAFPVISEASSSSCTGACREVFPMAGFPNARCLDGGYPRSAVERRRRARHDEPRHWRWWRPKRRREESGLERLQPSPKRVPADDQCGERRYFGVADRRYGLASIARIRFGTLHIIVYAGS